MKPRYLFRLRREEALKTFAVLLGLLVATPALASPEDDYIACLVGKGAVALLNQTGSRDANAAWNAAYEQCPEPTNMSPDTEIDGVEDIANGLIEDIAKSGWVE